MRTLVLFMFLYGIYQDRNKVWGMMGGAAPLNIWVFAAHNAKTALYAITFVTLFVLQLGCFSGELLLGEVDPETIPETPTYEEHVQPIIEYYCVVCHYPGRAKRSIQTQENTPIENSPFLQEVYSPVLYNSSGEDPDLSSYEAVVDEFDEVANEIARQTMPPGASRRLNKREETILFRWAAQGFAP